MLYSLERVCLNRNDKPILNDLSFSLRQQEVLGVIGLSGEGKSTLLNVILGFDKSFTGRAQFLGVDIRSVSPSSMLELVGYYSQSVGILNDSLDNNIIMGRAMNREKLDYLVDTLDLNSLRGRELGESGSFVSGGERQKVQLARLLYADKPFFILDEPLTNLDALTERQMIDTLSAYVKGKTGLIVSHKPSVLALADRFMVLMEGRILAEGTLSDLLDGSQLVRDLTSAWLGNAEEIREMISKKA